MIAPLRHNPEVSLLRCEEAGQGFALEMRWVRAIARGNRVRRAAGPSGLVGYLTDADQEVPVYGLAELLGRAASPTAARQHVVIIQEAQPWGLQVDAVQMVSCLEASILALPPTLTAFSYLEAVVARPEQPLLLLAPPHLRTDCAAGPDAAPRQRWSTGDFFPGNLAPTDQKRLVLVSINHGAAKHRRLSLGLSIKQVVEIVSVPALEPVPSAPSHVLGLGIWRERPLLVLDLLRRLGLPGAPNNAASRLVVARLTGVADVIGFPVQPPIRVLSLPVPHLRSQRPMAIDAALLRSCIDIENETIVFPDLDSTASLQRSGTAG